VLILSGFGTFGIIPEAATSWVRIGLSGPGYVYSAPTNNFFTNVIQCSSSNPFIHGVLELSSSGVYTVLLPGLSGVDSAILRYDTAGNLIDTLVPGMVEKICSLCFAPSLSRYYFHWFGTSSSFVTPSLPGGGLAYCNATFENNATTLFATALRTTDCKSVDITQTVGELRGPVYIQSLSSSLLFVQGQ
jgi:hypothetical protein